MTTPYDNITPESIKADMLREFQPHGALIDVREGSYTNTLVSAAAYQIFRLYQQIPKLLEAAFPGPGSGEYLDRSAAQLGMTRQSGSKAAVVLTFTGEDGTEILSGTQCYDTGSGLRFVVTQTGAISGGRAQLRAEAGEAGAAYNVPAGAIRALYQTMAGIHTVTNEKPASGGTDRESDSDLFRRYHQRLALPVTSGNPGHYVHWAREVPGVAYASCVPLWNGNGTVLVLIAGADRGPLDESIRAACAAHIEAERPIGATVTVKSVVTRRLDLAATVTVMEGWQKEDVRQQLRLNVAQMLEAWPVGEAAAIPYSRFLGCLLSCPGLADYSSFTVDGRTGSVQLRAEESPAVGTVTVS